MPPICRPNSRSPRPTLAMALGPERLDGAQVIHRGEIERVVHQGGVEIHASLPGQHQDAERHGHRVERVGADAAVDLACHYDGEESTGDDPPPGHGGGQHHAEQQPDDGHRSVADRNGAAGHTVEHILPQDRRSHRQGQHAERGEPVFKDAEKRGRQGRQEDRTAAVGHPAAVVPERGVGDDESWLLRHWRPP